MLNAGEWIPTKKPLTPFHRSYHLPSLYSPVGMRTWTSLINDWLECWDVLNDIPKDMDLLQQFYNNVLAESFTQPGEALDKHKVMMHRRNFYKSGVVPNESARRFSGGQVQLVTCAVDVHKRHLDVEVVGWCKHATFYSLEWLVFETKEGEDIDDMNSSPWMRLRDMLENKVYVSDDGKRYGIQLTLIDSGYKQDTVMNFCSEYSAGVLAIAGREMPPKAASFKYFWTMDVKTGTRLIGITTTLYKDRMNACLRRDWDGVRVQPAGHPNFPQDYPDEFFKQLCAETKKEKINATTGQSMGWFWDRPPNAANHAWDLTVYNAAALDMVAMDICGLTLGLQTPEGKPYIDWVAFWEYVERNQPFIQG